MQYLRNNNYLSLSIELKCSNGLEYSISNIYQAYFNNNAVIKKSHCVRDYWMQVTFDQNQEVYSKNYINN